MFGVVRRRILMQCERLEILMMSRVSLEGGLVSMKLENQFVFKA